MKREEILSKAHDLINGDRAEEYGDADVNFNRIANGWSLILGSHVTADQAALCMVWLKISRLCNTPNHVDSFVDAAGYVALAGELANNRFTGTRKND